MKASPPIFSFIFSGLLFCPGTKAENHGSPPVIWRMGFGSSYRIMGGVQFNTGSYSSLQPLPQLVPSGSVSEPYGPASGFADRTYDNGFVFQDINTGTPGAALPGTTAFWGYNDNNQVQGGNLVFTGTGTSTIFSQTVANAANPAWKEEREGAVTPSVDITGMIELGKGWHLGGQFGFLAPRMKMQGTSSTYRATQQSQAFTNTVIDSYDLQGVIPPLAPYAGVFNPVGPFPVIDNVPTSRLMTSVLTGTQTGIFTNSIRQSLELDFYIFSLGPVLEFEHGPWSVGSSFGFALNLVDWRASFQEELTGSSAGTTTTVARWRARNSGLDVLGGFYLQWQTAYAITPHISLSIFGRHDWMNSLSGSVGASSYKAVLDGFTFGTAVQFRF